MISLQAPEKEKKISLINSSSPLVSPEVANTRAAKYNYALGEDSPGVSAIYNSLVGGREHEVRKNAAFKEQLHRKEQKFQMIKEMAQSGQMSTLIAQDMQSLAQPEIVNPDVNLEQRFARKIVSDAFFKTTEHSTTAQSLNNAPEKSHFLLDVAEDLISRQEIARTLYEDLDKRTGVGEKIFNFALDVIPFYSWLVLGSNNTGDQSGTDGLALGQLMDEKVRYLNSLPIDQFKIEVTNEANRLAAINKADAQRFLAAVIGYSYNDKGWDNLFSLLDLSAIFPIGRGAKVTDNLIEDADNIRFPDEPAPRSPRDGEGPTIDLGPDDYKDVTKDFAHSVRKLIQSTAVPKQNPENVLSAAGKTVESATTSAVRIIRQATRGEVARTQDNIISSISSRLPTWNDPLSVIRGDEYKLDRGFMEKILDRFRSNVITDPLTGQITRTADMSRRAILDVITVARLSDSGIEAAIKEQIDQVFRESPTSNRGLADIAWLRAEDTGLLNVDSLVYTFKDPQGLPFKTKQQAQFYKDLQYKLNNAWVEPQGNEFVIKVKRDVAEDTEKVKDAVLETGNVTPQSNLTYAFNWFKNAQSLLPENQMAGRKVAQHGVQKLLKELEHLAEPIRNLPGRSKKRLERFATMLRDYVNEGDPTPMKDRFYSTQGAFERAWQDAFDRLPTKAESRAYWNFVQLNEFHNALLNLAEYRGKARLGIMNYEVRLPKNHPDGKWSPVFEGRVIDPSSVQFKNLPGNVHILIYDGKVGKVVPKEEIDASVEMLFLENYSLIQVADPISVPLKGLTNGEMVEYIVAKNFKSSPLSFEQVPFKPGGYIKYDYKHKVVQAKVVRNRAQQLYVRDVTIMPAASPKEAKMWASRLEKARQLWKNPDKTEFSRYVNSNLPISAGELNDMFENNVIHPGRPILPSQFGARLYDDPIHQNLFQGMDDYGKSQYNLKNQVVNEYADHGDLSEWKGGEPGTEHRPLLTLDKPRTIDPLSTINEALVNVSNNSFLDDYRILSGTQFVEEFWDQLDVPREYLRTNPVPYILNADQYWVKRPSNPRKLAAAKAYQKKVKEFLGVRTNYEKGLAQWQQKIWEYIYDNVGEKTADWVDDHLISNIKDVDLFLRRAAMSLKLGWWNPNQLWKQGIAFAWAMGQTNPINSLQSSFLFHMFKIADMSNQMPYMLRGIAKRVFGWKEDEFLELYELYRKSGVGIVENEQAFATDFGSAEIFDAVRSRTRNIRNSNTIFYRLGEKYNRIFALGVGYLEWRKKNPYKLFDRRAESIVLARQENLAGAMSRASNASWQKNRAVAIPLQFWSWQAKQFNLLWGRTNVMSVPKKIGVTVMMAGLYGVPIGVLGMWVPFAPVMETIRKWQLESGDIEADNAAAQAFLRGIPEMVYNMATGGKETNFPDTYGPQGFGFAKDILMGKPFLEMIGGASGNTLGQFLNSLYPYAQDFNAMFQEGFSEGTIKVTLSDFSDTMKVISTWNNSLKAYAAITTGKLFQRGQLQFDGLTTFDGILMGVFGISPREMNDQRLMRESLGSQREFQQRVRGLVIDRLTKLINDEENKETYMREAKMWYTMGGFEPSAWVDMVSEAYKSQVISIQDETIRDFIEQGPWDQQMNRREGLQ